MSLKLSDCSDSDLAALAVAGRQAAFGELVRRHQAWVFRIVRNHIGDIEEALDVTQGSFVAAFEALEQYDGDRMFRAWLARIAINKCNDWHRRRAVRRIFTGALPLREASDVVDETPSADRVMTAERDLARTIAAIAKLPSRLKEVLILRAIEGYSEAETAEILGVGQKAIETRLYRARARLTEVLGKK